MSPSILPSTASSAPTGIPSQLLASPPSYVPTDTSSTVLSHTPSFTPSFAPICTPTAVPAKVSLMSMQGSITLQLVALSSLTTDAIVLLQSSTRAAVANVASIPIALISTVELTSYGTQDTVSVSRSKINMGTTSVDTGIVASYSIEGPISVISDALNTSNSETDIASACAAQLNAKNGSTLLTSIKAQVGSSSVAAVLLTLLTNVTIAKVTVLAVIPSTSPSATPVKVDSPNAPSTALSDSSLNMGLYIGIAVTIFIILTLLAGTLYLRMKKRLAIQVLKESEPPANASHVILDFKISGGKNSYESFNAEF